MATLQLLTREAPWPASYAWPCRLGGTLKVPIAVTQYTRAEPDNAAGGALRSNPKGRALARAWRRCSIAHVGLATPRSSRLALRAQWHRRGCAERDWRVLITENADPQVHRDLEAFLARLVPDGDPLFGHDAEGPDDMPAHVRTVLTATELTVPVVEGRLALGTWQGLYLYEHRAAPHRRQIVVTITGLHP